MIYSWKFSFLESGFLPQFYTLGYKKLLIFHKKKFEDGMFIIKMLFRLSASMQKDDFLWRMFGFWIGVSRSKSKAIGFGNSSIFEIDPLIKTLHSRLFGIRKNFQSVFKLFKNKNKPKSTILTFLGKILKSFAKKNLFYSQKKWLLVIVLSCKSLMMLRKLNKSRGADMRHLKSQTWENLRFTCPSPHLTLTLKYFLLL